MPTSVRGLLLFVLLLAPGTCYRWRRNARQPVQKVSELREIAAVVLVSALCGTLVLALFGVWRTLRPAWALDAGRLVREGSGYVETAYVATVAWLAVLLTLACAVALGVAALADSATAKGSALQRLMVRFGAAHPADVTIEPAWWSMFANRPELIYLGCALDDGTYLGGYLHRFSAEPDETADRELVLTAPQLRTDGGTMTDLDVGAVVVSARRLPYLSVSYVAESS